jgi:uncharacterized protein YijF (DUF1287 family)
MMTILLLLTVLHTAVAPLVLAERNVIANAAMQQVGVTKIYDPAYVRLLYPGGDIPITRGVCADVVIRAFRSAGVDLQRAVHEDMRRNFASYPRMWGLKSPDANIDHRRVPNLMKYFERSGHSLSITAPYEPGDVVAWRLSGGLYHIGVVSNVRNARGTDYLVVHNIGDGAQNEDVLRAFTIIGHYQW